MSDIDVIDQRLRRVEKHLKFTPAGTQAGHSHPPGSAAVHSDHESRDDALAARVRSLEAIVAAMGASLARLGITEHVQGIERRTATM